MKPNILFIICHDLGQHLGCYGDSSVKTSNLDLLATEGVRFKNYFATAPQCSPSRASIITGRYPHSHGLMGLANRYPPFMDWTLPLSERTIAERLKKVGYSTYLFGLQHERRNPSALGFDEIIEPGSKRKYLCDKVSPLVIDFLKHSAREPFFANVGFAEVHRPYPRELYRPDDPKKVFVPPYLPDIPQIRQDIAEFHGAIRKADEAVGSILNALKKANLEENTLVIFTTDHGIAFPRAKCTLYDPGIKTTLIMCWPAGGITGGGEYLELLSNVDFLPTILDIVGAPISEDIQGRSFLSLLQNESFKKRDEIFAEKTYHMIYDPMRCIRTQQYKYILNLSDGPMRTLASLDTSTSGDSTLSYSFEPHQAVDFVDLANIPSSQRLFYLLKSHPVEELYDFKNDPYEQHNLANIPEYVNIQKKLRNRLTKWMEETKDPILKGFVPVQNE